MKAVIPAAGQGTRLQPHTDEIPKCMIPVLDKPILQHTIDTLHSVGITNISAICGYKAEKIPEQHLKKYMNPRFADTNMVYSFFCAEKEFDDDIILCYGDILFRPEIPKALIDSPHEFAVIVDRAWQKQWELRMEDPLLDAETMKVDANDNIIELGKKPKILDEIQGQYIGMVKIGKTVLPQIREFYHALDKTVLYNNQPFDKMYVTDFIQLVIDRIMPAKAVWIDGGWFEVDTCSDLEIINKRYHEIIA